MALQIYHPGIFHSVRNSFSTATAKLARSSCLGKKTFSTLNSYVIRKPLCTLNTSWKFVALLVKHPGLMSFKVWRSAGNALYQKKRTPKLNVILKKIITKGTTYTQTAANSISLISADERLKSPSPFAVNFYMLPDNDVFVFGLKI